MERIKEIEEVKEDKEKEQSLTIEQSKNIDNITDLLYNNVSLKLEYIQNLDSTERLLLETVEEQEGVLYKYHQFKRIIKEIESIHCLKLDLIKDIFNCLDNENIEKGILEIIKNN